MPISDDVGQKIVGYTFDSAVGLSKKAVSKMMTAILKLVRAAIKVGLNVNGTHKMSVQNLENKDNKILGTEVSKSELHGFNRYARKYNLDYSVVQSNTDKGRYSFFFKERDLSKLEQCLGDFCQDKTKNVDRSGLKDRIVQAQQRAVKINKDLAKEKTKSKAKAHSNKEVVR